MKEFIEKLIGRLEETDFNDIQMVVREVLLKYGFPYESVVQDEVWNALDELSTNKFAIKIVNQLAEEYNNGWVLCSEMLPDDGVRVLTCDNHENVHIMQHYDFFKYPFDIYPHHSNYYMPVAWQPLPEPYEEENL